MLWKKMTVLFILHALVCNQAWAKKTVERRTPTKFAAEINRSISPDYDGDGLPDHIDQDDDNDCLDDDDDPRPRSNKRELMMSSDGQLASYCSDDLRAYEDIVDNINYRTLYCSFNIEGKKRVVVTQTCEPRSFTAFIFDVGISAAECMRSFVSFCRRNRGSVSTGW